MEVGCADDAVGVNHVGEDVVNVAGRTVELRANLLAFAGKVVALRTLRGEDRLATGEARGLGIEVVLGGLDQLQQLAGRRTGTAPGLFDELVQFLIVEGLDANDRVAGDLALRNLFIAQRLQQLLGPRLAAGKRVDEFGFYRGHEARPSRNQLLGNLGRIELSEATSRFDADGERFVAFDKVDEQAGRFARLQTGQVFDRLHTIFD